MMSKKDNAENVVDAETEEYMTIAMDDVRDNAVIQKLIDEGWVEVKEHRTEKKGHALHVVVLKRQKIK